MDAETVRKFSLKHKKLNLNHIFKKTFIVYFSSNDINYHYD